MSGDFPDWADEFTAEDPDRAVALQLLPPGPRRKIAALYALAHQMKRAARISPKPELSEIRLQWWIDATAALPDGASQHPVLAAVAADWGEAAPLLAGFGEAERTIFAGESHDEILARIDATSGDLAWIAAAALGAGTAAEEAVRAQGRALGVAEELGDWGGDVELLRGAGQEAARKAAAGAARVPRAVAPVLFAGPHLRQQLFGGPEPTATTRRRAVMRFALTRNWRITPPR